MVFTRKSTRFVFLLWAISVCLLCVGSLINFHQNKIWGKPLISGFVAIKREADHSVIKMSPDDNGFHGFDSPDAVFISNQTFDCYPAFVVLLTTQDFPFIKLCATPPGGLRAPPVSC